METMTLPSPPSLLTMVSSMTGSGCWAAHSFTPDMSISFISGGFSGRHGHFLFLLAERFVPCFDRILARRQAAKLESSVFLAHREERVIHHGDVAAHPRVHVALDVEILRDLWAVHGLARVLCV